MPASHSPRLLSLPRLHRIFTSSVLVIALYSQLLFTSFAIPHAQAVEPRFPISFLTGLPLVDAWEAPPRNRDFTALEKEFFSKGSGWPKGEDPTEIDFLQAAESVNRTLVALETSPEAREIKAVVEDQTHILLRAAKANLEIEKKVAQKKQEHGEAGLSRLLATDDADLIIENKTEKSQPTTIDKQIISRVVLTDKDLTVVTVNPDRINSGSQHLKQYIARQLIDANQGKGHDVLLVWSKKSDLTEVEGVEYFRRPGNLVERWKTYKISVYTPPSHGDKYVVTPYSLRWQLSMVTAVNLAAVTMHNVSLGAPIDWNLSHWSGQGWLWAPMVLTTVFCIPLGIWSSTYRNFTQNQNDTKIKRVLKRSIVAFLYAEAMLASLHGLGMDGLLDPHNQLKVFLNVLASKWSTDAYQYWVQIRTEMRLNTGVLTKTVFGEQVEVKNQSLESIRMGQIPSSFKLMDQTSFGKFNIDTTHVDSVLSTNLGGPHHQIAATLGQALLYGLILPVNYTVLRWAEKVGYKKAPAIRKDWNTTLKLISSPFWGPVWVAKKAAEKCVQLLSRE